MRRDVREAYSCPCEGERWPAGRTQSPAPHARATVHALAVVRSVCGVEPPECPWNAWADRDVATVVSAWQWFDKGQLETHLGADPPHWILDGVRVFGAALDAARADFAEIRRQDRVKRGQ